LSSYGPIQMSKFMKCRDSWVLIFLKAPYKAGIAQELLKEEKTLSQVASETGIHPTQLKEWKKIALNGLPELFSRNGQALNKLVQTHAEQVNELYAEIGRLTTQSTG